MSISFSPSQLITITQCIGLNVEVLCTGSVEGFGLSDGHYSLVVCVVRAHERFVREFAHYEARQGSGGRWTGLAGCSNLSEVRKYHRLLITAVRDLDNFRTSQFG